MPRALVASLSALAICTSSIARADDAPLEVTITGDKHDPGETTFDAAEVRALPGAFGDPFRAIDAMPGVTPLVSGLPYFYVRGAPPGDVGYFVDGVRVPLLFHIGLGPSVVNPALAGDVALWSGGYPAEYGGYSGAIVTGSARPPSDVARGEAELRLVDAGALVESPFDNGKATALVGGRYSYTAPIVSLISPQVKLDYWDYQARVTYEIDAHDRLTAFAFGSHDYLGNENRNAHDAAFGRVDTVFDSTFHRLDLRLEHDLGAGSSLRQDIILGTDRDDGDEGVYFVDDSIESRTDLTWVASDRTTVRAGIDALLDGFISRPAVPGEAPSPDLDALASRGQTSFAIYASATWRPSSRVEVTPGLRAQLYATEGLSAASVEPRLAVRITLAKPLRLVSASGLASQPAAFFVPGPAINAGLRGGLQRTFQTSGGLEADLPAEITASATVFYDGFFEQSDPLGVFWTFKHEDNGLLARTHGHAFGLEVSVRRRLTKRLGGLVAYTLSRSERVVDIPALSLTGEQPFREASVPSGFDRTHVFNAALSYDFGGGYRAGVRTLVYSGIPSIVSAGTGLGALEEIDRAITEPDRLPVFFRLDVRAEKRWRIGARGWLSAVLEVENTTLAEESVPVDCQHAAVIINDGGSCRDTPIGPVTVPSLGLEGGF